MPLGESARGQVRKNSRGKADEMRGFEEKICRELARDGIADDSVTPEHPLGVAVSGGADSVSLLCALHAIFGAERLSAITINHNIREARETAGDAEFVCGLCARLGVHVRRIDFVRGEVARVAAERGHGIEDAARFLRYEAFDAFCEGQNLRALCLAHTKDDMLETLLMRFLQGSGAEGGAGIARRKGLFVRPLLDVGRAEIESYLNLRGQDWRTDSTNEDTAYLRNNIRKNLVPLLNEHFAGWKTALLSGAEKAGDDNAALQTLSDSVCWRREKNALCMGWNEFCALPRGVRRRVLHNAFNQLGGAERIPYSVTRQVIGWNFEEKSPGSLSANGLEISVKSGKIYVKKCENKATESGFFDIIKEDSGSVLLRRSLQNGDCVRTKDGAMKPVQKIFGDWKVSAEDRNCIPLVQDLSQEGQPIVAILGSELGYSDWIVR